MKHIEQVDQVDDELVELAVEIFKMLADPTRIRIVLRCGTANSL